MDTWVGVREVFWKLWRTVLKDVSITVLAEEENKDHVLPAVIMKELVEILTFKIKSRCTF